MSIFHKIRNLACLPVCKVNTFVQNLQKKFEARCTLFLQIVKNEVFKLDSAYVKSSVVVMQLEEGNIVKPNVLYKIQYALNRSVLWLAGSVKSSLVNRLHKRLISLYGAFLFGDSGVVVREYSDGCIFVVPLSDGYWSDIQCASKDYEPDVMRVLLALASDKSITFVDAGSNRGFFPARMSPYCEKIVSIEASVELCDWINLNSELNNNKFVAENYAVWSVDDLEMSFSTHKRLHPGGGLTQYAHAVKRRQNTVWSTSKVRTISLNSILARDSFDTSDFVVVKLDVEGAELSALQGCGEYLDSGKKLVFIYEHMSKDEDTGVFNFFAERGWVQVLLNQHSATVLPDSESLVELTRFGKNRGFNVLSTKSLQDVEEYL